jgi:hypothetical protein
MDLEAKKIFASLILSLLGTFFLNFDDVACGLCFFSSVDYRPNERKVNCSLNVIQIGNLAVHILGLIETDMSVDRVELLSKAFVKSFLFLLFEKTFLCQLFTANILHKICASLIPGFMHLMCDENWR